MTTGHTSRPGPRIVSTMCDRDKNSIFPASKSLFPEDRGQSNHRDFLLLKFLFFSWQLDGWLVGSLGSWLVGWFSWQLVGWSEGRVRENSDRRRRDPRTPSPSLNHLRTIFYIVFRGIVWYCRVLHDIAWYTRSPRLSHSSSILTQLNHPEILSS